MSLLDELLTSAVKNSYEKNKRKESEPSILGALKDPQFLQDMKRGVLDSVNRGAVASTIGGPVDLATMALRPLGYNVEKPIGGSEWVGDKMQQLGLLGDTRNPIAEALASVAVPGAMAKVAPKVFQAEQAAIQNANIAGPLSDGKFAAQRGVFGGLSAKTADKAKLSQAEQMLSKGVDPAQVWKETGWGRGPDGKWRFEIDDTRSGMRLTGPKFGIDDGPYNKLGETLDHREAFKAYPDSKGISVTYSDAASGGSYANPRSWAEYIDLPQQAGPSVQRSTTLHELQHAIQQREGFARGGSPEAMPEVIDSAIGEARRKANELRKLAYRGDPLDPFDVVKPGALDKALDTEIQMRKLQDMQARLNAFPDSYGIDAYQRLGGEAEARLVQSRMNLTPEERAAQYPWNPDYFKQQTGVGLDDLIHRFDGGEAKSVGFTYPQDAALETARKNGVKMLGLPENNTPMDRAKALGFDTDVYHGSPNFSGDGFSKFESGHRGASGNETAKIGTWVTDSPSTANDFAKIENAGTETRINPETGDLLRWEDGEPRRFWYDQTGGVLPLKVRGKDFTEFSSPAGGDPFEQFMDYRDKYAKYISGDSWRKHYVNTNPQEANAGLISDISAQGKKGAAIRGTGYDANDGQKINQYVVTDPSAIRSRFAAFDPARINENDLLAGAMPFGLLLDPDNRAKLGVK